MADSSRPIGEPIIRLSNLLLSDEVRLEGDTVSRTTYAALFEKYGTTYGAGDGSTTFKLPDFRNRAIWGASDFGYIEAGLPNITGNVYDYYNDIANAASGSFFRGLTTNRGGRGDMYFNNAVLGFDASRSNSIYGNSNTVQPPAIKVRVVTRYK